MNTQSPFLEAQPEDFAAKRREYFQRLSMRYLDAFRPHKEEGQLIGPKSDPEVWRNVTEHCITAGAFAELMAQEMCLTVEQVDAVAQAAIVHDWYKKHEALASRKERTAADIRRVIAEKKGEDQTKLLNYGVSNHVIAIAGANLPSSVDGPQTDEEKIMWYIDAMLTDTKAVPISQRFDDLENHPRRGEANKAFSESYRDVFGGKSLYELQRSLGDSVGAYIAQRIGYEGEVQDLPLYLQAKLEERIISL